MGWNVTFELSERLKKDEKFEKKWQAFFEDVRQHYIGDPTVTYSDRGAEFEPSPIPYLPYDGLTFQGLGAKRGSNSASKLYLICDLARKHFGATNILFEDEAQTEMLDDLSCHDDEVGRYQNTMGRSKIYTYGDWLRSLDYEEDHEAYKNETFYD